MCFSLRLPMIARTSCLRFVSAECSVLLWLAWLWLTGAANVLAQGNLRRLYGELSERQGGAFRASLRTVPMTRGVNVALGPPSAWLGGDDGESEADAEDGAADGRPVRVPIHRNRRGHFPGAFFLYQ